MLDLIPCSFSSNLCLDFLSSSSSLSKKNIYFLTGKKFRMSKKQNNVSQLNIFLCVGWGFEMEKMV